MPSECIKYSETNYFSPLILDYLSNKPELDAFYHRFPSIANFGPQLEQKQQSFSLKAREALVESLVNQYKSVNTTEGTRENIELLRQENTFTITTGHQLNLFTGPLYFLYKIVSVINLCRELQKAYPESNFVPIYWMATEDHDFEEINFFNLHGKKIQWNP